MTNFHRMILVTYFARRDLNEKFSIYLCYHFLNTLINWAVLYCTFNIKDYKCIFF